ncbi:MFS transporter [Asanoa ishikariensis]|uniref:Predicted arabinose efflux permease, MFS family n=1 Tax=Asanoa ishikariensis TaxID=137265 RepID=A0A1H3TNG2_9ACTN|nr:MFS transporter [Asanoa ishikariensis]GIF62076.1 MFS transporter [Asanoa ishikariensis]SDZ51812.1 Predicted arabinose efflux permease, MFS family [Asanoa ishikariensis]
MFQARLLRNRRFLSLWAGDSVALVGVSGVRIAYPLMALAVTGDPAVAGWVTVALTLPALLFHVPAGVLADAVNRRQLMLACQVVGLLGTLTIVLAAGRDLAWVVPLLVGAAFVEGTAYVFFSTAEVAAVRDAVDDADLPAALSYLEAEYPIGNLAGRVLGATLFGVARWAPFAFNAVSYLVSIVALAVLPKHVFAARPAASGSAPFWERMAEGLRWTWSVPFLRVAMLTNAFTNLVFQVVILLVIVVGEARGYPPWMVGVILAAAGAGGLAGAIVAPRLYRNTNPRTLLLSCVWAWTVAIGVIAMTKHPVLLGTAWGAVGVFGTIVSVVVGMTRVRTVPDAALARVLGATAVFTDGAVALGALCAGYLLATLGADVSGWVLFGGMVVAALLCSRFLGPVSVGNATPALKGAS